MHRIIAAGLTTLGVVVGVCPGKPDPAYLPSVLCFRQIIPGDVHIGGAKVVGSAQRRQKKALLQHGAILLAQSPFTPELPGIQELTGVAVTAERASAAVCKAFARMTGWELAPGDWTAAERQRIDELVAGKYTADTWNRKR
jgi:lipoate-protein ligase A